MAKEIMTYGEWIEEAKSKEDWWKYNNELQIQAPQTLQECNPFIENYFDESGKALPSNFLDVFEETRIHHIVSAFFFGVSLYNKSTTIRLFIDKELNEYKDFKEYHEKATFAYSTNEIQIEIDDEEGCITVSGVSDKSLDEDHIKRLLGIDTWLTTARKINDSCRIYFKPKED